MNSFRSALDKGEGFAPTGPLMPGKKPSGASESAGLGSIPVPRDAVRNVNHRDDDRHRLAAEEASLKVGRKSHAVELVNLSGGGAMIGTDVTLEMWQKVYLGLGDCSPVECAVRWIKGDRVGLEFAHETQIGGDEATRAKMLLDVLNRNFPESSIAAPAPKQVEAPTKSAKSDGVATGTQRRVELRHPLIWWGEIHYSHETSRVRLRNISESGALVDSDTAYPADAEVLLDLAGAGQHFAIVSWSRGDQVGLKFASPFDIALLSKSKPEVTTHQWARPAYLKSGRETGSGNEGGWDSASLPALREDLEGFWKR